MTAKRWAIFAALVLYVACLAACAYGMQNMSSPEYLAREEYRKQQEQVRYNAELQRLQREGL